MAEEGIVRGFKSDNSRGAKPSHYHRVSKLERPYPNDPSLPKDEQDARMIAAERAERELTPSELLLVMREGDDEYLTAKEKKAELCNDSLRHLVVEYFQKKGNKIIEKAEIHNLAKELVGLTDEEFKYLQDFAAKNSTPLTPAIMNLIVEQYRTNKKLSQSLYDTINAKFQYYGAQFVTGRSAALGHLVSKVMAPCAGAVVESAKTAAKGVGVMFASVFVRDHILPILFTHVLPTVAGYAMGENATMVNSTGANATGMGANATGMDPNATMGGARRKGRKTHKRGKRSGRKGKTHRRR
jgi:hypothetical protein